MEEPPDPGGSDIDPSCFSLEDVAQEVTISLNKECSSMDTDGSLSQTFQSTNKRKHSSNVRICKHCNKRRRRRNKDSAQIAPRDHECHCVAECNEEIVSQSSTSIPSTIKGFNFDKPILPLNQRVKPTQVSNKTAQTRAQNNIPKNKNVVTNIENITENVITNTDQTPKRPSVARPTYQSSDAAPYLVHIQKQTVSPNDGVTLHPISFGRFLKRNSISGIVNGSLKRIGRNKISLSFSNYQDANLFLENENLQNDGYKVFIPTFSVTRMGIVRGVPSEWSEEEVKDNISVPVGCGQILKVRRLNRKVMTESGPILKATESVVLTFDGQVLPKRIFMCYNALQVDIYIFPTIQCYRCCRFGHVVAECRASMPRCFKCGEGHRGDSCSVEEENVICCLCKGSHVATSKTCLEYSRQKAIKESMAKSCISYADASKIHPPVSKISYADALLASPSVSPSASGAQPEYSPPRQAQSTSYKKTVFLKPRSPPKLNSGYDRAAHSSLIQGHNIPEPCNGCALKTNNNSTEAPNNSVTDVIISLIKSLSQSNLLTPSNAAPLIDAITKISNDGQLRKDNSMELSERYFEKK